MKKDSPFFALLTALAILFFVVVILVILKNCVNTASHGAILNGSFNFSTEVPRCGSCAFTSDLL